jgi:hypothetical protein
MSSPDAYGLSASFGLFVDICGVTSVGEQSSRFPAKYLRAGSPVVDGYPATLRKVIYKSLNRVIRHVIKKRKVFPTDDSVKKVV